GKAGAKRLTAGRLVPCSTRGGPPAFSPLITPPGARLSGRCGLRMCMEGGGADLPSCLGYGAFSLRTGQPSSHSAGRREKGGRSIGVRGRRTAPAPKSKAHASTREGDASGPRVTPSRGLPPVAAVETVSVAVPFPVGPHPDGARVG